MAPAPSLRATGTASAWATGASTRAGAAEARKRSSSPLTSEPEVTDDSFAVSWEVSYSKEGAPDYVLPGHSRARYADDVIVELVDSFGPEVDKIAGAWITEHAPDLDPSYV